MTVAEVAAAMLPLLARGRLAWRTYVNALPEAAKPIGGTTMLIVRDEDFRASLDLCLAHVRVHRQPLYILDANNDLSCHMGPFTWRR